MQSGTTNQSPTTNSSSLGSSGNNSPVPQLRTLGTRPSADAIASQFAHAETPEEFIKRNLERLSKATPASPEPYQPESQPLQPGAAPEPQSTQSQPSSEAAPGASDAPPAPPESKGPETRSSQTAPSASPEIPSESSPQGTPEDGSTQEGSTLAENIRNLRKSLNENKALLKQKEDEIKAKEAKLKSYETGEVLPDAVKQLEARVQELSKYEALVNLEASPEYQEKFQRPMEALVQKLETIGKDYEIPEGVLTEAVKITNQKELNRFLANHFDELGASDVRNTVREIQSLQHKAEEARQTPKEALSRLVAESSTARAERQKVQRQEVAAKARSAWVTSLQKIQQEGSVPEITIKENDSAHNNLVKPILESAAAEFGKLVTKLVDAGMEKLPDDLSDALANMVVLAHASAVMNEVRNHAVTMYNEIERAAKKDTEYRYPPIGGSFGTGTPAPKPAPMGTVEQESRKLMDGILGALQNKGLAR